jgi:two-component system, cell cycle response regulator DivK
MLISAVVPGAAARILIVEDYPPSSLLLRDLLEVNGFAVSEASTAEAGVAAAHAERPDLILMDLALPGMDGLEATRRLKQSAETRDICIVALSAHAMKDDADKALRSGCDAYLTKPIETRSFVAEVRRLLAGHARVNGGGAGGRP